MRCTCRRRSGPSATEAWNGPMAWRYEFFASCPLPTRLQELRPLVRWWEQVYNHLRPHQGLNYQPPAQYLAKLGYEVPKVVMSHYVLSQDTPLRGCRTSYNLPGPSGEVSERSKEHAWKVCVRQKRTEGSNPSLSANTRKRRFSETGFSVPGAPSFRAFRPLKRTSASPRRPAILPLWFSPGPSFSATTTRKRTPQVPL